MHAELIARLEKAESGSRELDAMVAIAVRGGSDPQADGSYKRVGADFWRETSRKVTTITDSAVTLIGDASPLRGPVSLTIAGSAQASLEASDPCGPSVQAVGNTAPLALCIALLRALDTEGGEPHG